MKLSNIFKRDTSEPMDCKENQTTGNVCCIPKHKPAKILTTESQQKLSAVYRCVDLISNQVAQMDIFPYRWNDLNQKEIDRNHSVFTLFKNKPNQRQTKFMFMKTMIESILLKGQSYQVINRDQYGRPVELVYIPQDFVLPYYNPIEFNIPPIYFITGYKSQIEHTDIIHLVNKTYDGVLGISVLRYQQNSMNLYLESDEMQSNFFNGGLNGFIKVQGRLNDKQLNDIQNQWNRDNNSIKILQGNMEFVPLTVDPDDTQLLESRNFNILDIARFFGVPASKLNQKEGATYNGIESENIAFLSDTIQPLIEKIEDEFELKLLSEYERINYEIKFDISKLLRTDLKAQSEYYRTLFNIGIFSQNEIRKQLDMNNIQNGDQHYVQVNMMTLDQFQEGQNLKIPQDKQNENLNNIKDINDDAQN